MNVRIDYRTVLTTDHPLSSYGRPVMIYDGQPYGPADLLPNDLGVVIPAGDSLAHWANDRQRAGDPPPKLVGMKFSRLVRPVLSDEQVEAIRAFCSQNPDGVQVLD